MNTMFKILILNLITGVMSQASASAGGDRDSHGCIASAGYVWCDDPEVQRCIRIWEEVCEILKVDTIQM